MGEGLESEQYPTLITNVEERMAHLILAEQENRPIITTAMNHDRPYLRLEETLVGENDGSVTMYVPEGQGFVRLDGLVIAGAMHQRKWRNTEKPVERTIDTVRIGDRLKLQEPEGAVRFTGRIVVARLPHPTLEGQPLWLRAPHRHRA
jgi:hypothetical protein